MSGITLVRLNANLAPSDVAVDGYLVHWHPFVIFLLGFVLACAIILLIYGFFRVRRHDEEHQLLDDLRSIYETERKRSEAILQNIDIGLIAYSPEGKLALSNEAASDLMNMEPPERLSDLLDQWPSLADVRAALVLGSKEAHTMIDTPGRRVLMRFREAAPNGERLATIVVLRDVTREEREMRQRREFVANVSHELKTPITTIRSYTESLIDWGLAEKERDAVRGDLVRINDDAMRMERLVSDLLLLSSLDSEGKRLSMEEIDMKLMVRQILERFRMQATREKIDLSSDVMTARVQPVFADYQSLERILSNLVSNALKYTESYGTIRIILYEDGEDVCVDVRDSGRGIPAAQVPFIFDRFYRVDATGSRKHGGTGLGLSIAKELVTLHHGKLDVKSVLGEGSTFTMKLPTARSVYRTIWDRMRSPARVVTDPMMQAAEEELTKLAHDYGYEIKDLNDLGHDEIKVILSQYDVES